MFIKLFLSILTCFIPMIAGFFIFLLKAKIKPLHLLFAILLGLVAIVPGSLIQYFIPKNILFVNYPILHSLIVSLLIYGLSEEIFLLYDCHPHAECGAEGELCGAPGQGTAETGPQVGSVLHLYWPSHFAPFRPHLRLRAWRSLLPATERPADHH